MDRIRKHFEDEAQEFDEIIVRLIPGYSEMVEALVTAIPLDRSAAARVIDLGCGTGSVAKRVLEIYPNARMTCVDLAETMISMARGKLARYRHVSYLTGDFNSLDLGGNYNVVLSSLSLHHLLTDDDKRRFYRRVYHSLAPGGVFYNADLVLGSSDHLQSAYMCQWRSFMRRSVSQEEIDGNWIPKYQAEDRPAKLIDQLGWLSEIGFAEVDVLWKRYNFAAYGGRRP